MRDLTPASMLLTYALVLALVLVTYWQKLGIGRDLLFSSLRGTAQLFAVGYLITWIFSLKSFIALILVITVMCAIATQVATVRIKRIKGLWKLIGLTIFSCVIITLGILALIGAITLEGQYVIPIGGMLIGHTMTSCTLFLDRILSDIKSARNLVESNLALGATPLQAIHSWRAHAIKADAMPTLDMLKTLGVIHLPGMMSGLIIGGVNPLIAVKYQLLVVFMLVFSFGLSSIILAFFIHYFLFNSDAQLRDW